MPSDPQPRDRWCDAAVLATAVGLLALAAAFHVDRDAAGREQVRAGGRSLPPLCVFRLVTDVPCPTCGVTRSVVACVHGDLDEACAHHAFGLVVVFFALFQIPYRIALLAFAGARRWEFPAAWRDRLMWSAGTALVVTSVVKYCR